MVNKHRRERPVAVSSDRIDDNTAVLAVTPLLLRAFAEQAIKI